MTSEAKGRGGAPFRQPPSFGQVSPVAPGVLWLRMPLPFALDHVNLWLLEDGAGWALVDTGVSDPATRDLWQGVFATAMAGKPLSRLLVTHFHPDHIGLAAWLQRRFGCPLETSRQEWLYGRMLSLDTGDAFTESSVAFYRRAGLDEGGLALVRRRGNAYAARTRHIPVDCQPVQAGQELSIGGRLWRVISGRGHSPDMVCLHCPDLGVLISGDQVLAGISPNVSVWPSEPEVDPLSAFLDSLRAFRALPAETLVLPSHGVPFHGLHDRLDQLAGHHDQRLAATLAACAARPLSAAELMQVLFPRDLDSHQLFFALGESLAHLHALRRRGQVSAETGADGVRRFQSRPSVRSSLD